jgi:hypothetical protein
MKLSRVLITLVFIVAPSFLAHAQGTESPPLTDKEMSLLFGEFKAVRVFGMIAVDLVGDAEKIGLNEGELTNYVKESFKKHFGATKYEDISKDSEKFLSLVTSRDKTVGNITMRIWVIGDEYPIVYHVRCDAGNFHNPSIWTDEVLGHGSRKTTPEAIMNVLDEMMRLLAATYFKVQGQAA